MKRGTDLQRVAHVALAVLIKDGKVLLAHRRSDRLTYPECWDVIGGHVELGETAEETVVRECAEELGVQIWSTEPAPVTLSDPEMVATAFLVDQWHGQIQNVAADEHDELAWFTPKELRHLELADPVYVPWLINLVLQRLV